MARVKATDDDPIAWEEDAAITAENLKIAAEHKAVSEAQAGKAEAAFRELCDPPDRDPGVTAQP